MKNSVYSAFPASSGAANSNRTLLFRPSVTRLMAASVPALASPTTSHQLSSFFFGKRGASTGPSSPSSISRSSSTISSTVSPVSISSAPATE